VAVVAVDGSDWPVLGTALGAAIGRGETFAAAMEPPDLPKRGPVEQVRPGPARVRRQLERV
jgi:hypothetical protein